jgi:hypothetical protein
LKGFLQANAGNSRRVKPALGIDGAPVAPDMRKTVCYMLYMYDGFVGPVLILIT